MQSTGTTNLGGSFKIEGQTVPFNVGTADLKTAIEAGGRGFQVSGITGPAATTDATGDEQAREALAKVHSVTVDSGP